MSRQRRSAYIAKLQVPLPPGPATGMRSGASVVSYNVATALDSLRDDPRMYQAVAAMLGASLRFNDD
jgi:hypothetical protein